MKHLLPLLLTLSAFAEPVSLFDGKTLDNWSTRQGEEKWWRVQDGMITGGSLTETLPFNCFLASQKTYQNFELKLKIKLTKGEGFINSGIQIRSTRVPNNSEMSGYQVDAGIDWWGKLYDESRRNRVIGEPVDAAAIKATAKDWDWNEYRIVCEGKRIRSWINGVAALDYTEADPNIPTGGLIGVQAHAGGKFLVQFKDITINELPATAEFKPAEEPKMQPIQNAQPRTAQEQKASFHLPPGFEIELVAAEDPAANVGKFISVYFDQRGRMWTQTALEYPVDANENAAIADALYASKAKDKIIVYDRAALFDKPLPAEGLKPAFTFAEGLAIPLGILPWGDGSKCYALHGRDIVLLTDTDNDNKADKQEVLLTGFGVQDSHLFPHQFTRAPGGWIWMAQGAFNYSNVRRPSDPADKTIKYDQTRMARIRPDGSAFEITSNGPCNIWGLVIDRNGESFIQEANDFGYGVMPFHEYGNYPGCSDGQWKSYSPEFPGTFVSQRFGGTGLSGLCLTDKEGVYPAPYNNLMLVANPITNRINTVKLEPVGKTSVDHYLSDWKFEKIGDFVTCDDPWFRPVAMTLGPDGCVYIVDWYNKIISHNEVPRTHPDRDKIRGRIWRIKHQQQKAISVPDFTKLDDKALAEKLGSPSLTQTVIAYQTLADRKSSASIRSNSIAGLWAWESSHINQFEPMTDADHAYLQSFAKHSDPQFRREAVRVAGNVRLYENKTLALEKMLPLIKKARTDEHKNVRRECINSVGNLLALGQQVDQLFGILLDGDLGVLPEPLARSTRGNKMIPVREAYDREYERYLTRMFLERQPEITGTFLSSAAAKNLPVESQLLAALALPPAQGAVIISGQLAGLKRAPNAEEVLRLVQALDQPQIQQSLQAGIANPATSQTIIDALLKNKNRIPAERMQSLLTSTVDQLFKGNAEEVQRAVALSAAFSLTNTAEKLLAIAQAAGPAENRIAALDAIATQQNGEPAALLGIYQKEHDALQLAAVRALASSRQPNAASQALGIFAKLGPALQRQVIEALCSHKEGALALVKACLDGQVAAKNLNSIAIDRLQVVLHDDPSLKKLLDGLSDIYRPVLALKGNESSFVATNISLPGAFTVETWVKLDPEIDNRDSLGGAPGQLDLNFFGSNFRIYVFGAANDVIVAKKQTIAGLWTHIAAVRDEKGSYKIYINGELDNAVSKTQLHRIENFRIGWSSSDGGSNEQLAEFRIWNRERSAAEIRANFDRSLANSKDPSLLFNGSGDQGWGTLNEHASISRATNLPPVMSLDQAAAFDKKYQHMLTLAKPGGKAEQGKTLAAVCMGCHQFGNAGGQIGPNLSSVGAMGPEAIVRNILTPNAAIEPGYRIFRVEMKDGSLVDAFFVSEDKDAILVRQMGAGDKRIERKNIQSTQFLRQSLMPEGLLDAYSDDQVKDLFSFLMSLK